MPSPLEKRKMPASPIGVGVDARPPQQAQNAGKDAGAAESSAVLSEAAARRSEIDSRGAAGLSFRLEITLKSKNQEQNKAQEKKTWMWR